MKRALVVGVTLLVSACVAPSQPLLDQAIAACQAGDPASCATVPTLRVQVANEHEIQGMAAAAALLGVAAAALDAASEPTYVYVPAYPRHRHW